MKIGIVSPYYMHAFGGVQTLIKDLRRLLVAKGHEVIIIAPKARDNGVLEKTPEGVVVLGNSVQINFKNPFHTTFPIAASNRQLIADFLNQEQFDVLNIHEPWMPLLPYQILRESICPVVGTTHARWPRSLFNKSLERVRTPYFRSVLNKVSRMTAVSEVAARNITFIDSRFPVQVIPNGIDLTEYKKSIQEAKNPKKEPYILYLNRLEKRKGPRLLLKAYLEYVQETMHQPLPLVIAGAGPQMYSLQSFVERYNLGDLVTFEGFVSNQRKMELFANAHLYVSPAPYGESFGIVLLEAMAADLPIVAGNNEGYRSVLKNRGAGSLVNPYKTQVFARFLDHFGNDEDLRQDWLTWAQAEVELYDYPLIADQYEACFLEAIK